jgi:hypothetical protein
MKSQSDPLGDCSVTERTRRTTQQSYMIVLTGVGVGEGVGGAVGCCTRVNQKAVGQWTGSDHYYLKSDTRA